MHVSVTLSNSTKNMQYGNIWVQMARPSLVQTSNTVQEEQGGGILLPYVSIISFCPFQGL